MKRFAVFSVIGVMVMFSAGAIPLQSSNVTFTKIDGNVTVAQPSSSPVTYTFSSGNDGACYVKKASGVNNASTFWFCGKKPTSAKCGSVSSSSQDTVYERTGGDSFTYESDTYYCCDGNSTSAGKFKKYASSEVFPKTSTKSKNIGGGTCEQKISTDACGKETVTEDCKIPTSCPSGKYVRNDVCVSDCPSGQHFKSVSSNECEADATTTPTGQTSGQTTTATTQNSNNTQQTTTTTTTTISKVTIPEGFVAGQVSFGAENITNQSSNVEKTGVVSYESLWNDDKSCWVKKSNDDSSSKIFWCGKQTSNMCGTYKPASSDDWTEIYDGAKADDKYCCCGGSTTQPGVFQTCTEPGTRTKIKNVSGGVCQYTVQVDSCNREKITQDCSTPDSTLSVQGKTPVTKSNMQECSLCTTNDEFKTCILNSCYELNADIKRCPEKLKRACLIKK